MNEDIFLFRPPNPPRGWRKSDGYYVIESDGTVFINGNVIGSFVGEELGGELFYCACFDGEPVKRIGKAFLFRMSWLKEQAPKRRSNLDLLEQKIREVHGISEKGRGR